MDTAPAQFDWIGWLATIPGVPAGWGEAPANPAPVSAMPAPVASRAGSAARFAADLPRAA